MMLTGILKVLGEQRFALSLYVPQITYRMPWEEHGIVFEILANNCLIFLALYLSATDIRQ